MDIQFSIVKDLGNKEKERVILKVLKNTDLGGYMVATSLENDDNSTISASVSNVFWLPDQKLKIGDLVVLYTMAEKKGKIDNKDGSTSYFYSWGLNSSIGNNKRMTVVLFEVDWSYRRIFPEEIKADELLSEK